MTPPTRGSLNPTSKAAVATMISRLLPTPGSIDITRPTDLRSCACRLWPIWVTASQSCPSSLRASVASGNLSTESPPAAFRCRSGAPLRSRPSASSIAKNMRLVTSMSSVNTKRRSPSKPPLLRSDGESSMRAISMAVWIVVESRAERETGSPRSAIKYSAPSAIMSPRPGVISAQASSDRPVNREKNRAPSFSVADSPTKVTGRRSSQRQRRMRYAT